MIGYTSSGSRLFITELLTTTFLGLSLIGPAAAQDLARIAPGVETTDSPLDSTLAQKDLQTLLPLLLTSSDRRQLAADLEGSIRKGDLKAAETSLNTAIEVGTLAIVLSDHLNNPDLLKSLQDLNVQASAHPPSPMQASAAAPSGRSPTVACTTTEIGSANLAELQEALEQERSYGGMVSQTLTALMQEHNALAARLESDTASQDVKSAEMQQALQREQERSGTLEQELHRLKEEYQTLQAAKEQASAPADIVASDDQLREERERKERAERQLAGALKDLKELQGLKDEIVVSATSKMADLEKALARAQMRGDVLTQELTVTSDELRALKEPRQPGPAPVVFRLAAAGAEPPLGSPLPETVPAPAAQASALPPEAPPTAQDTTSALPFRASTAVVVAALPESIQPLPLTSAPPLKGEPLASPEPAKADDRLVSRAEELLNKGDVSSARLLLERALTSGHARAAFLLAETFDPNVLSKLGTMGLKGDAAKAREFYTQAQTLGMAQARERLEALR
jgi:predicted  nucleic acid-binding Zn-ribbon protein